MGLGEGCLDPEGQQGGVDGGGVRWGSVLDMSSVSPHWRQVRSQVLSGRVSV